MIIERAHLPNVITVSRLLVVPFGIYLHGALREGDTPGPLALLVLVWLIAGDYLDGILARRWRAESNFGRQVDPFVDKTFLATMLLVYGSAVDEPVLWTVILIRFVPDAMTFILSLVEAKTKRIKGSAFWGKRKTDVDFVALLIAFTPLLLSGEHSNYYGVIGALTLSTILGFIAFGYYLKRLTRDARPN